jgi:4-hydroxybenzoate polyprenyltransferase
MPFALISYVYALTSNGEPFDLLLLVKILLCMVFARNAAMGFNRWADRRIDAENPRTASREIPAGKISPRSALLFVAANALLFVLTAWWINSLCLALSPAALFVLLSYSYTKRFTSWSHIVLGVALGIAPVGAYIAVTGHFALYPMIMAAAVVAWVGGFDILYSMQDAAFDRENSLRSIPARFSPGASTAISVALHLVSIYAVSLIGLISRAGGLYWTGTLLFILLLVIQHVIYRPSKIDRIGSSFGLVNGLASIAYAAFAIADLLA